MSPRPLGARRYDHGLMPDPSDQPGPTAALPEHDGHPRWGRVAEVAWVFAVLGTTAFGGPAAHVAMMEEAVVRRRGWLSREAFLDLHSATNFIPGPNSTELAIHIGYRRAGWLGLFVGGVCFIMPAVVIVTGCAWCYVRYGELGGGGGAGGAGGAGLRTVFSFVSPVIVAIVAQAILILGKSALVGKGKGPMLWAVAAGAVVAVILGVNELLVLACAGLVMAAAGASSIRGNGPSIPAIAPSAGLAISAGAAATASATPGAIFWIFAKIGSVLFGSGYVLLAFLQAEFVERRGWLTQQQMIDSVAVGQFTPGPVFTTATFIGYLLGGLPGAGAATLGIFSPAFLFVAITAPLLPRLRRSRVLAAALDGVNAASLSLMAVVMVQLAGSCLNSWWSIVLAMTALGLLARWNVNSAWLVLGSVLLAIAAMMVR